MANVALNIVLSTINNMRPGFASAEGSLRGLREQSKAASEEMQAQWGAVSDLSRQVGAGMVVAGGAMSGGILAAAKSAADYGSKLYDLSAQTGVSVEMLSELDYAASQTGADLQTMATGFRFIQTAQDNANQGQAESSEAFKRLGINIRDANGKLKDSETLFMETAEAIRKVDSEAERTSLARKLFGRGGTALLPAIMDASGGLGALRKQARALGLSFDGEASKGADQFGDKLGDLEKQSKRVWMEIGIAALPMLTQLANFLSATILKIQTFTAAHPTLAQAAVLAAFALGLILVPLGTLLMLAPGIVTAWSVISKAMTIAKLAAVMTRVELVLTGAAARVSGLYATFAAGGFQALAGGMTSAAAAALPVVAVVAVILTSILALIGGIKLMLQVMDDVKNHRWGDALKNAGKAMLLPTEALEGAKQVGEWIRGAREAATEAVGGTMPGAGAGAIGPTMTPAQMEAQLRQVDAQAQALRGNPAEALGTAGLQPQLTPAQAQVLSSAGGNTVNSANTYNMPITINGATDPQATAQAVRAEVQRNFRAMSAKQRLAPA